MIQISFTGVAAPACAPLFPLPEASAAAVFPRESRELWQQGAALYGAP